ncbi:single-stranded DNA-binding protein [Candidatus Pacearchaeota archaeon]|nr:single-stranded DNA-binding protein [Candidatus Pacearchaeota archaeon]
MNLVVLTGDVRKDPETRTVKDGKIVTSLSLATTDKWTDKQGNKQEKTDCHKIVFWGKLAEVVNQHVKKGDKIEVIGSIHINSWNDADGKKQYNYGITARQFDFLG